MALGEEPGSLVLEDGTVYGPNSIDLDTTSHTVPIWRFKVVKGTKAKQLKGLIPVREAYEALFTSLIPDPTAAMEWEGPIFSPPGSSANRALSISVPSGSVCGTFLAGVKGWYKALTKNSKFSWDEAVGPANFVPIGLDSISANAFCKTFSRKEFASNEHNSALGTEKLLPLPKAATSEEFGARQNLLCCLNSTFATEALASQQSSESAMATPLRALIKLSLQPLWAAFGAFCRRRMELRKKALRGCNYENRLVQRLVASDPLTEDLFDQEAVDKVLLQAENQAKPVLDMLGFKPFSRKRSASSQRPRSAKRARFQGYRRQQAQKSQTPGQMQGKGRGSSFDPDSAASAQGRSQSGWRGRSGKSPRGRGSRSPGNSRRQQSSQGDKTF